MTPEQFIFEMYESAECQSSMYARMAITKKINLYYSMKRNIGQIHSFMVPFRDKVKAELIRQKMDLDSLLAYMIPHIESCRQIHHQAELCTHRRSIPLH